MPQTTDMFQPTSVQSPTSIETDRLSQIERPNVEPYQSVHTPIDPDGALGRLLVAALINKRIRQMLLLNPMTAVAAGYQGDSFHLSAAEQKVLVMLKANTLNEFAQMLLQAVNEHNEQVFIRNTEV